MASSSPPPVVTKAACRAGLYPRVRRAAWLTLALGGVPPASPLAHAHDAPAAPAASHEGGGLAGDEVALVECSPAHVHYYNTALREVFGNITPAPPKVFRIPFLGVEPTVLPPEALLLLSQPSIAVSAAHDRVIAVLAQLHSLRYCPQVPNLALLLLHVMGEAEAFTALEALLRHNQSTRMLMLSRKEEAAFVKTFRMLIKNYFPRLSAHLESLSGSAVRTMLTSWFRGFFMGWLPPDDVHNIIDAYLYEGPKVLLRYGLALCKLTKKKLKTLSTGAEVVHFMRRWVCASYVQSLPPLTLAALPADLVTSLAASGSAMEGATPYSFDALSHAAFKMSNLSRKLMLQLMDRYLAAAPEPAPATSDASGGSTASGAHAAALSPKAGVLTPSSPLSAAAGTPHMGTLTSPHAVSAEAQVTLGRQNAILTAYAGMPTVMIARLLAGAPTTNGVSPVSPTGAKRVHYSDVGSDEADVSTNIPPVWHNPKIVGLPSRLMTPDFSPVSREEAVRRIRASESQLQGQLYKIVAVPDEEGAADADEDGDVLLPLPTMPTSNWLSGLYASVGRAMSLGTAGRGSRASVSGAAAGGSKSSHAAGAAKPTAASIFGLPAAATVSSAPTTTSPPAASAPSASAPAPAADELPSALANAVALSEAAAAVATHGHHASHAHTRPVTAIEYAASSSPYLSSLCALLPAAVQAFNWACVYSTDIHGCALDTMVRRTRGLGPVLIMCQVALRGASDAASSAATSTTSKLATVMTSRRPVFGFYSAQGLTHHDFDPSSSLASMTGTAAATSARAYEWLGTTNDFFFQLYPELTVLPVQPASAMPSSEEGGSSPAGTPSTSHPELAAAHGFRTHLYAKRFVRVLDDFLCVGGHPGRPGRQAFLLQSDMQQALASTDLLADMSVPMPAGAHDEVPLDVLSVEAYTFMDRSGGFPAGSAAEGGVARNLYRQSLEAFWAGESVLQRSGSMRVTRE